VENISAVGTLPRSPLGALTELPRTLSWWEGVLPPPQESTPVLGLWPFGFAPVKRLLEFREDGTGLKSQQTLSKLK